MFHSFLKGWQQGSGAARVGQGGVGGLPEHLDLREMPLVDPTGTGRNSVKLPEEKCASGS